MVARGTSTREPLAELVLKLFRLNGLLLDAGDRLTEGSGLTSARWQVLGAVLGEPLSVAAVARNMGLARQSVQRIADVLVRDGLCEFLPNPAHRRAMLLTPTDRGWKAIEQIRPRVAAWNRRVTALVGEDTVASAGGAVDALLRVLASPEGQVKLQAQSARVRHRRKRK